MMDKLADTKAIHLIRTEGAYVSSVSVLEMSIKYSLGKLDLPSAKLAEDIQAEGFLWLNITPYHAQGLIELDYHHRDPFDRLLISQAKQESMRILTYDSIFRHYLKDVMIVRK